MEEKQNQQKTKEGIYAYLKEGLCKKDAALMSGISEKTFYRWVSEDDSFDSRVEASILEYKHSLIKKINIAAEKDGRLALEVLSRRFPNEWSVNRIVESDNGEESIQQIAELLQDAYKKNQHLRKYE